MELVPVNQDTQKGNIRVFISYVREDKDIADSLVRALDGAFGSKVRIFQDTKNIGLGVKIDDSIKAELRKTDVLLLLSSRLVRYCPWVGFEFGYFQAISEGRSDSNDIVGKAVTIIVDETPPSSVDTGRHVVLSSDWQYQNEIPNNGEVPDDDDAFKLLCSIEIATSGKSEVGQVRRTELSEVVRTFKGAVFETLRVRVKTVRKPEKQLLIRFRSSEDTMQSRILPNDADIYAIGDALDIFGIGDEQTSEKYTQVTPESDPIKTKQLSWEQFCDLTSGPMADHWIRALSNVAFSRRPNEDHGEVIASTDRLKRYRVVLTTASTYYNGTVQASIYLLEALKFPNYGSTKGVLLLKGLNLVYRFRLAFFEKGSQLSYHAIASEPPARISERLPEISMQILRELDLLHSTALEAELANLSAWVDLVPIEPLQEMLKIWPPIEEKIRTSCGLGISGKCDLTEVWEELIATLSELESCLSGLNLALLESILEKIEEEARKPYPMRN